MRKLHFSIFAFVLFVVQNALAQCPYAGTVYGTVAAPASSCTPAFASPGCHFTSSSGGDIAEFTGLAAGSSYTVISSATTGSTTPNNDFLTVYLSTATTTSVASGSGGTVTFTAPSSGTYHIIIASSATTCGTAQSTCRYLSIQNNSGTAPVAAVTTTQPATSTVAQGATNSQVLRIDLSGLCSSTLTSLNATTGTTTSNSDIATAKVYYTNSTTFATTTQFGATITSPSGTMSFTGSQALSNGVGYLWLVYDVNCTAVPGNIIDGSVTDLTLTSGRLAPTTPNPTGTRTIISVYAPAYTSVGSTTVAQGSTNSQIVRLNVTGSSACSSSGNGTVQSLSFSLANSSASTANISSAKVYYTTSTTFATTTQYGATVTSPSGTITFTGSQALASGTGNYFWLVYDVPCASSNIGDSINAVASGVTISGVVNTPTGTQPTAKKITSSFATAYTSVGSTTLAPGSTVNPIVRINATGSSACVSTGNGTVESLSFSLANSSASTANISSARVYYTTSTTFSTTTQYGAAITTPSGTLTFTGSQALASGTGNYFWLVYDLSCTASTSDSVNATATSITISGTATPITGTQPTAKKITGTAQFSTTTNGDWNNPAIWSCGAVPTTTTNVSIAHAVSISNTGNVAANVTITSSGSLTLTTGGLLALGNTGGGNQTFINNGTLTVTGGTLNINGSMLIASGSTFNQSGGDINVDGNDGTSAGSVGIGTDLIGIGTSGTNYAAGVLNLTGGTITIIDPHFSGTATSSGGAAFAFRGSVNRNLGTGHTLRIGGTTGINISTASFGFYVDTYINSAILQLGNVEVNGGTGNRSLFTNVISGAGAINIGGNLTINSGCRMVDSTITTLGKTLAGNIVNNGTLILSQATVLATLSGSSTTAVAVTTPQSISGTGVFQNASVSPTANIATLTINNSSNTGVTLNVPIVISGTLTLTAGKVNTTSTNLLTLGYNATNVGTLSYSTNSWVNGPFKRWISAATGSRAFPVGNADSVQLAIVNYTTAPTTAGSLTSRWVAGNPGFPNATSLIEGALVINRVAPAGSWFIDAADGLAGGNYTGSFTAKGYSNVIDYTKLVLLKRPSAGGDWTLDGTHVTTTGSNIAATLSRTGMSGFSQFAVGGEANVALPIKFEYLTGKKAGSTNALNWKVTCTSTSITMVLERSADARTFNQTITSITASQARCGQPFDAVDAAPINGISYYHLKMIDVDGTVSYSPVAAVLNGKAGAELVGIYPTVVKDQAYLSVTSSRTTTMQFSISDMSGKVIKTINQSVSSGSSMLPVNTSSLASGVYNITGLLDGVRTQTLRFVKQ